MSELLRHIMQQQALNHEIARSTIEDQQWAAEQALAEAEATRKGRAENRRQRESRTDRNAPDFTPILSSFIDNAPDFDRSTLRSAGAHLFSTLSEAFDPSLVMQVISPTCLELIQAGGSQVIDRLMQLAKTEGFDKEEICQLISDEVFRGAMNQSALYGEPSDIGASESEADHVLDTIII